ncbi:Aste57867_21849 [Aphanomyces stellatus]|uniref:Aste57867_21849 protein n=1 Tax=Aphanomyces stellatus TaxID=120398 RepID=A0A485LIL8_9STRA|nr:hypothetical protein As57867_021780 [Aphanomyces stellatus]VFT98518.1 Aste57867_21849 [Aphanomyces stellatus]
MGSVPFDGWYVCSESTDDNNVAMLAECGKYTLPLCYPGVCAADASHSIHIFVKRIPATVITTPPRALWLLQGLSSVNLEPLMASLFTAMNGTVTILTMDHRGTGRSSELNCVASQAMTSGSPSGSIVTSDELPGCLHDLRNVYGAGNAAAFSITSAAMDLWVIVDDLHPTHEVYMYGVGYGTMWLQRAMLLSPPPSVQGFVLDSVVGHSGVNRFTLSNGDATIGPVAAAFFLACDNDAYCGPKFSRIPLVQIATTLYIKLDSGTHPCSPLVQQVFGNAAGLKLFFSALLESADLRFAIPPMIYRLARCNANDRLALQTVVTGLSSNLGTASAHSNLAHNVIAYSELWEIPTPSIQKLTARFDQSVVGGGVMALVPEYCVYTGVVDPACVSMASTFNLNNSAAFTYLRDAFFNQTVTIPPTTTVLMMNGDLDPQTPIAGALAMFTNLVGPQKRFVTFPTSVHATALHSPTTIDNAPPCGQSILASYVASRGVLSQVDTTCLASLAPLTFQVSWGATGIDLFDGVFPPSSTYLPSPTTTFPTTSSPAVTQPSPTTSAPTTSYLFPFTFVATLAAAAAVTTIFLLVQVHRGAKLAAATTVQPDAK